jgi:hypothetical protein
LTLKIKPVKLRQSIYFRVPSDIANLIGLKSDAEVTLNLEEQEDRYLLTYTVLKPFTAQPTLSFHRRHTESPLQSSVVE